MVDLPLLEEDGDWRKKVGGLEKKERPGCRSFFMSIPLKLYPFDTRHRMI